MESLRCLLLLLLPLLPFSSHAVPHSQSTVEVPANNRVPRHAARLALQFLNYQSGSPHQLLEVTEFRKATLWTVPEVGHKYYVEFSARVTETLENIGLCTASVFFLQGKSHPSIYVNCSSNKVQKQARDNDYEFYKLMKAQTSPITAGNIPDNNGNIEPQLKPIWGLGKLGSSYIILDKSTEDKEYNMAQIKSVKQVLRQDNFIALDYTLLLHERPSEEMVPCNLHVVWSPGRPPKVDYSCTDNSDVGSGNKAEEGSGFLGNFK